MKPTARQRLVVTSSALAAAFTVAASTLPASALSSRASAREFDSPSGLAFGDGHLWVSNTADSSVSEINPTTGAWLANFHSPGFGYDHPTAITSFANDLFIANANNTVTEIHASNGSLVRRIAGAAYRFSHPVALTTVGDDVVVLNSNTTGSLTEFSAVTGDFVRNIHGPAYAFSDPIAFAATRHDVFVADKANNSVTEVDAASGRLIHVIAQQGLSAPDGVAIGSGNVWVADQATSGVTEISAATGHVLANKTDANGGYGFWHPTVMISTGPDVYVATPLGTSPMVTKLSSTTAQPYWFMCNTNGPYYFSLLSAFAINGGDLWVTSRSGANSKTPGAATGSLTELALGSGALLKTLPTH